MNDIKWIKITTDMFDNRKVKYLRKLPNGDSLALIWVMLLTLAGRCNAGGRIFLTEDIPYTPRMLADELDCEESTVTLALDAFARLDMAQCQDDYLMITGWEEYQNVDSMNKVKEQNKIRKQNQREREKAAISEKSAADIGEDEQKRDVSRDMSRDTSVTVTPDVTRCHATEREKEIDKDKEYNSISLSINSACARECQADKALESFGGKVMLSPEQVDDLLERLSLEEFDRYVDIVADCEARGKHFGKPHYVAILEMAAKDRGVLPRDGPAEGELQVTGKLPASCCIDPKILKAMGRQPNDKLRAN